MGTVRLLFWVFCFGSLGWGRVFNGYCIGYEEAKEISAERLLAIARKDIGIREATGRNDGERISQYLAYLGFKEGAPYCAAAISAWFREAGFPAPRTAWCPAMFPRDRVVEVGGIASKQSQVKGLVVGIYFPSLKRIAHVGLIESARGDYVQSIEANTNIAGSRNGDGVYRKIRHRRTIYKYADWL